MPVKLAVAAMALILNALACAQGVDPRTFDGELKFELLGSNVIPRGTVRLARGTFINNGPGIVPLRASIETFYDESIFARTLAVVQVAETAPCDIFFQDIGTLVVVGVLGPRPAPVLPGESASCIFGIYIHPEAPIEFTHRFTASFINDLNPANNFFDLVIRTEVEPIQVPALNPSGALFLAMGSFLLGMWAVRRFS